MISLRTNDNGWREPTWKPSPGKVRSISDFGFSISGLKLSVTQDISLRLVCLNWFNTLPKVRFSSGATFLNAQKGP